MRMFGLALLLAGGILGVAAPPCTPPPEVRDLFESEEWKALFRQPWAQQFPSVRRLLAEFDERFPGQQEIATRIIYTALWTSDEESAEIVRRFTDAAEKDPNDPMAQAAAGYALFKRDTPRAIRFLERAAQTPGFGWPHLTLARIYESERFSDKARMLAELDAYFRACPGSNDGWAQGLLSRSGDIDLQRRVAADIRARLESGESDLEALKAYETLWGIEFRIAPVSEHGKVRQRLGRDVVRIEELKAVRSAGLLQVLRGGFRQAGDEAGERRMAGQILGEFPTSREAYFIVEGRWREQNPEPQDHRASEAWKAWMTKRRAALEGWRARFPDESSIDRLLFFSFAEDRSSQQEATLRALDAYLRLSEREVPFPWATIHAAQTLKDRGWQLERAVELYRKAVPMLEIELRVEATDDTRTAEEVESASESWNNQKRDLAAGLAKAARLAGKPEKGVVWREIVEGEPPKKARRLSTYWHARSQLAWLEGRKADALAYMQSAMHTRTEPDSWYRGQPDDEVAAEARALWKEMGGTEAAWDLWSKPPAQKAVVAAASRWETPRKPMPGFELTGLDGKIWRLEQLEGKKVLINVWATWCGPCVAELPLVQKLHEQTRESADVQVITFNIDDELGLVAPFLKEKGYTFPVLPAGRLVNGLLDGNVAIPQNWLVNGKGEWVLSQVGFDASEPDWPAMMVQKLKALE